MNRKQANNRLKLTMILATVTVFMLGCSAFKSKLVSDQVPHNSRARHGLAYFLPTGKLHIIAIKTEVRETNDLNQIVDVVSVNAYESNVTTKTSTTITGITAPIIQTNASSTFVVSTNGSGVTITTDLKATNKVETTTNSHAGDPQRSSTDTETSGSVRTFGLKSPVTSRIVYQVTINEQFEKDGKQLFLLDPSSTPTSSDAFRITVGNNGLLTSINSTNSDKSGEILVELAKAAAEAFKLSVGGISPQSETPDALPDRVEIVFDPFDPEDRRKAKEAMEDAKLSLNLDAFERAGTDNTYTGWSQAPAVGKGVYYRPSLPYEVTIESGSEFRTKTVMLPNKGPILSYDIRRAAFVTTVTQLGFSNGCLVEVAAEKPSEALEIAKTPMKILQSLASLPTNILQLKFDIKSATQKLNNLNTNDAMLSLANLEAQIKLIEAAQRLTNAFNSALTNTVNAEIAAIESQIRLLDAQQRLKQAQRNAATNH